MDIQRRLVVIIAGVLALSIIWVSVSVRFLTEQEQLVAAARDENNLLRGASDFAYRGFIDELQRDQSDAAYLSTRPSIGDALQSHRFDGLHDDVLEPYRRLNNLTFIAVVSPNKVNMATASAGIPALPATIQISGLNTTLARQEDSAQFWDGPKGDTPFALASSPVIDNQQMVGAVLVGRRLDDGFVATLSSALGSSQVALEKNGALLATPPAVAHAFQQAKLPAPFTPVVSASPESTTVPSGWTVVRWTVGAAAFQVLSRPLYGGSTAHLAIAGGDSLQTGGAPFLVQGLSSLLQTHFGVASTDSPMLAGGLAVASSTLLTLAVALLIAIVMSRQTFQPVRSLARYMSALASGEPSRAGSTSQVEPVASMAASANSLAQQARTWRESSETQKIHLESVLDSARAGLVLSDGDGKVSHINPTARELLGLAGGSSTQPLPVNMVADVSREFQAGSGRYLSALTAPVLDGETPAGTVTVLLDQTENRELDRVHSDFLSVVSHELRTPLTAIKGSVDLLLDGEAGELDAVQQRFLTTARRNTERLVSLVNDLLELSRMEAGQTALAPVVFDLQRAVAGAVEALAPLLDRQKQTVTIDAPDDPVLIEADRRRIEQVVTNLLTNAARFTPMAGTIAVCLRTDRGALGGVAVLTVSDNGPGVDPADAPHVFEKFYRGGNALTREPGGAGLGLAIVRSIVELHGGSVTLASHEGGGASFIVQLPLVREQDARIASG